MTAARPIDVIQWIRERLDFDPCHECDNATIAHDRLDEAEQEFEAAQAQGAAPRAEGLDDHEPHPCCRHDECCPYPSEGSASSAPQALDVDVSRLGRAIHRVFRHGVHGPGADDGDGDLAAEIVFEYSHDPIAARLAPSEPTETGETP